MREHKFRIWDGNNKCFEYPDDIELNRGLEYQQFTGLHDKDGQDIYEGDVLLKPDGTKGIVEYCPGFFGIDDGLPYLSYLHSLADICKIIGNKFENPELLDRG